MLVYLNTFPLKGKSLQLYPVNGSPKSRTKDVENYPPENLWNMESCSCLPACCRCRLRFLAAGLAQLEVGRGLRNRSRAGPRLGRRLRENSFRRESGSYPHPGTGCAPCICWSRPGILVTTLETALVTTDPTPTPHRPQEVRARSHEVRCACPRR